MRRIEMFWGKFNKLGKHTSRAMTFMVLAATLLSSCSKPQPQESADPSPNTSDSSPQKNSAQLLEKIQKPPAFKVPEIHLPNLGTQPPQAKKSTPSTAPQDQNKTSKPQMPPPPQLTNDNAEPVYYVRVAIPNFYDSATVKTLTSKATSIINEASRATEAKLHFKLVFKEATPWPIAEPDISYNALSSSFPIRPNEPNVLVLGLRTGSVYIDDHKAVSVAQSRPFLPWITMQIPTDNNTSVEDKVIRANASTLIHEIAHINGVPHFKTLPNAPSLMDKRQLRHITRDNPDDYVSQIPYVMTGQADDLRIDEATEAIITANGKVAFNDSCEAIGLGSFNVYIETLEEHTSDIDPETPSENSTKIFNALNATYAKDEKPLIPAHLMLAYNITDFFLLRSGTLIDNHQYQDVEKCITYIEKIESTLKHPLAWTPSLCVKANVYADQFNVLREKIEIETSQLTILAQELDKIPADQQPLEKIQEFNTRSTALKRQLEELNRLSGLIDRLAPSCKQKADS